MYQLYHKKKTTPAFCTSNYEGSTFHSYVTRLNNSSTFHQRRVNQKNLIQMNVEKKYKSLNCFFLKRN